MPIRAIIHESDIEEPNSHFCHGNSSSNSHLHNASEPDILDDKTSEMRSDTPSNSTNFTSSGGSGLVISGEPAYVGDTLTASLMVTNKGNSSGSVSLQINHSDSEQIFQGEYISISPGSTREVPASFILGGFQVLMNSTGNSQS